MMKNISTYLVLFLAAFFLTGCAGVRQTKQLASHQNLLTDYSLGNMPTEEKVDALATSLIKMMNESMSILNPKKGVAYVKRYNDQNKKSIDLMLKEIAGWQDKMDTVQKISFVAKMLQKPYTKELFDLIPKFERKYRQVKFVMNLTSKVKKGLGGLAGKVIGL